MTSFPQQITLRLLALAARGPLRSWSGVISKGKLGIITNTVFFS